ncbi:disease resistance protein Pik-2-like [Miscanthus floridulus]|uniref:disease resistance protein Pik-2-like n=1 Tax=Miscanthus floridulus TaxID=154761 RepID=UPI0034588A89
MADLAVGISKAAVEALVSKVQSAIKEDAEKWLTVQRDLVFITGEFEMMRSFLDTASEEHVKNKIVGTWVRQVRDLSNDVEDSIDFILHIDTTKRSWWLRLLPSCGGKTGALLPVDEAVAETTLLRARVVDVSQRNIRYNLISDSGSKPLALPPQEMAAASTRSFGDILLNATKKKSGLSDDLAGLIIREDKELQVISICGTGGDHGKISIIRKAYGDQRIHKNFQCRAWVKLQHPFNPHEFIRSLVAQFYTNSCEALGGGEVGVRALTMMEGSQGAYSLTQEFVQQVNKQRYLVVLEDLSTISQWDDIRTYLPDMKNGSRIVASTHDLEIASLCPGEPCLVSELRQFSADHSVYVFYKEAFQNDTVHSFIREDNYGLLGRETQVDKLFDESKKRRLISVWGMPGVGKSVLVRAIYDKFYKAIYDKFYYKDIFDIFYKNAWVNVSHPFNPTDFNLDLLKVLIANDEYRMEECRDNMQDSKCLVVIDGLQSKDDWDFIKSNLKEYGDPRSCIIIVTSDESVAKHCAPSSNDAVYNIKGLEPDAACELFIKVLGEKGCYLEDEMEEEEANYIILPKCGGLPGVIITVARYLTTKPRDVLRQEMMRLSDNFMQELASNPEFDSLRGLPAWMHSYLDACPRHLKKCMLYLSIFSQDTIIRRRRLIRRWIAEGYSKGTDSNSVEKYAEKMFDEVAALSIMQTVLEAGKEIGYRVNGFFREYVLSAPLEETIFFPVEVSALEKQGQGHGRLTTEGTGQHLAIGRSWELDRILFESLDFSRLRSLTVFQLFLPSHVSDRMRVLRVLDLENAWNVTDDDFNEIGKLPSRLKFLSLRGQSRISQLPEPVGGLAQLQTLDIRGTRIRMLPPFITRLRKLQYIRAGTTVAWTDDAEQGSTPPSSSRWRTLASSLPNKFLRRAGGPVVGSRSGGVVVPSGIDRLEALQTLGAVCVNTADGEAIVAEIVSLPQLKKLEISGISGKQGRFSFHYNLSFKKHLESLTLQFEKHNHFVHWQDISFPTNLRSLKMYGHVEELPGDIKNHDNLVKLTLEMTTLFTVEVIEVLGSIPNLQTLRLRVNKDQDGELQFPSTEHYFRKLQVLEIACKSKLHLRFHEGAMQKLEHLNLHCLEGSEMQFSGLEHPVSLKQVWLLGSFDDELKRGLQHQLVKHPMKPAPRWRSSPVHLRRQRAGGSP